MSLLPGLLPPHFRNYHLLQCPSPPPSPQNHPQTPPKILSALRDFGAFLVDRPTQLVCIWIFICWVGGGNPCGVADFCIGDSCRNKKHTGFIFFFKISFLCIFCPWHSKKQGKKLIQTLKKLFLQFYLIRSWSKSSWTRFGRAKSSWTRFGPFIQRNDTSRWR